MKNLNLINKSLAKAVFLLALVCLALLLAFFSWSIFTSEQNPLTENDAKTTQISNEIKPRYTTKETIRSLSQYNPWETRVSVKKSPPPKAKTPEKATPSTLELELIGTMVLPDIDSWAVLVSKKNTNKQIFMRVGDEYENYFLDKIERNAVYFKHQGKYEIISMALDLGLSKDEKASDKPAKIQRTSVGLQLPRDQFMAFISQGKNLLKGVSIAPYYSGNKSLGYQLDFKSADHQFENYGIEPKDVIEKVNGINVTDTVAIAKIFKNINKVNEFNIDITRDGQQRTIQIGITQ